MVVLRSMGYLPLEKYDFLQPKCEDKDNIWGVRSSVLHESVKLLPRGLTRLTILQIVQ